MNNKLADLKPAAMAVAKLNHAARLARQARHWIEREG